MILREIFFWVLCFCCAFTGMSACGAAIYVFYKIRETGDAEIKLGRTSVHISGRGAALIFALGAVFMAFAVLAAIYVLEAEALRSKVETLQGNVVALQQANEALLRDRTLFASSVETLGQTSENIPRQVDRLLARRFQELPSGEDFQTLASRIDGLDTSLERVEGQQMAILQEQQVSTEHLKEAANLLRGQSDEVGSIAAGLARMTIQDQVYEMLADALPTRYTPIRWEMVEVRGSKPRRYELKAASPIIEEKDYTLTSRFEGNTLVLNAIVEDEKAKAKLEQAIRAKGIEPQVKAAGFQFTVNFSFRRR